MATGLYDERSIFHESGGFAVVHKEHNRVPEKKKDENKEEFATRILAEKGYKVYLDSEKSTIKYEKNNDGRIYQQKFEFKTINKDGDFRIKNRLEEASKQNVSTVVLIQNTTKMSRDYVERQIDLFIDTSPRKAVEKINHVIVVGMSGNIHRRDIRKDKERRLKK